jgi:hypothetical protein
MRKMAAVTRCTARSNARNPAQLAWPSIGSARQPAPAAPAGITQPLWGPRLLLLLLLLLLLSLLLGHPGPAQVWAPSSCGRAHLPFCSALIRVDALCQCPHSARHDAVLAGLINTALRGAWPTASGSHVAYVGHVAHVGCLAWVMHVTASSRGSACARTLAGSLRPM